MEAQQRREKIIEIIEGHKKPISASLLAKQLLVSRQIIVGDVALLRAAGVSIIATPRGYIMEEKVQDGYVNIVAVNHDEAQLEDELTTIVDYGGTVVDVIVEHPLYGQLCGNLHITSKYDVEQFMKKCKLEQAAPLSKLTHGVHLHKIHTRDIESFQRIVKRLDEKGYLYHKD